MKRLAILGAGDLGKQIAHHAKIGGFEPTCFFDDTKKKGERINGVPVFGGMSDVKTHYLSKEFDAAIIGVGYKHFSFRKQLYEELKGYIPLASIIPDSCVIDPTAKIGEGVMLYPGSIIDANVRIEDNVLINLGCIISHDSIVGKHSFLAPGVTLAGFVSIGECCNLGIRSTLIDHLTIAAYTQVGGGAVVVKDIEEAGLYFGVPAKRRS